MEHCKSSSGLSEQCSMGSADKEMTVTEVLSFLHDVIRLQKSASLDGQWWEKDPSDWQTIASSFRSQSIVRLVENVVKHSHISDANSLTKLSDIVELIKRSLNSRIQSMMDEGLLDSILPYVGNILSEARSNITKSTLGQLPAEVFVDQKASVGVDGASVSENEVQGSSRDPEVIIHVVDDVRGDQKPFYCSAKNLLEKMPYFTKATKGQNLTDVDITVHCDVNIFHWLVEWMNSAQDAKRPSLEPGTVVPILLSAAFLEMEVLVEDCLNYCHSYMNQILDTKQSFSCLSDSLIERLSTKFSVMEVEQLGDKRSSIQSRLYTHLITDLCTSEGDARRGLFRSATTLYRCSQCSGLLTKEVDLKIPCKAGRVILTTKGEVFYRHERDVTWNLTEYVKGLKNDLKTWRRVFWRLWAQTHFLECTSCNLPFAAAQWEGCRYHTEWAVYGLGTRTKSTSLPVGKFPCCQQVAYRFSLVPGHNGCHTREHTLVNCQNEEQVFLLEICRQFRDLIIVPPFKQSIAPKETRSVEIEEVMARYTFGMTSRPRKHLVPLPRQQETKKENNRPKTASSQETLSTSGSAESEDKFRKISLLEPQPMCYEEDEDDAQEDVQGDETDDFSQLKTKPQLTGKEGLRKSAPLTGIRPKFSFRREQKLKPLAPQKETDLRWNMVLSNRSNQDNQRYMEEEIFHRMTTQMALRHWQVAPSPIGGIFAKIQRHLAEKAQREARLAKLAATRSAMATALAARKFKVKLNEDKET